MICHSLPWLFLLNPLKKRKNVSVRHFEILLSVSFKHFSTWAISTVPGGFWSYEGGGERDCISRPIISIKSLIYLEEYSDVPGEKIPPGHPSPGASKQHWFIAPNTGFIIAYVDRTWFTRRPTMPGPQIWKSIKEPQYIYIFVPCKEHIDGLYM